MAVACFIRYVVCASAIAVMPFCEALSNRAFSGDRHADINEPLQNPREAAVFAVVDKEEIASEESDDDEWNPIRLELRRRPTKELRFLCGTLGLKGACDMLLGNDDDRTVRAQNGAKARCLPPGKLTFVHVMKTGGMSVDWFLHHACSEHDDAVCSIERLDFQPHQIVHPDQRTCDEPSVCTLGNPNMYNCTGFEHGRRFTVIRDPVDRVWSFYNFLRPMYKPFQTHSLRWLLENHDVNLDHGLHPKEMCDFCQYQLSNGMARHHFNELAGIKGPWHIFDKMDLIMDVHAIERFPEIAAEKKLFPANPSFSGHTQLKVPRENDETQYPFGRHPNKTIRELIMQVNKLDISLYTYAQTLPNYVYE